MLTLMSVDGSEALGVLSPAATLIKRHNPKHAVVKRSMGGAGAATTGPAMNEQHGATRRITPLLPEHPVAVADMEPIPHQRWTPGRGQAGGATTVVVGATTGAGLTGAPLAAGVPELAAGARAGAPAVGACAGLTSAADGALPGTGVPALPGTGVP